MHPDFTETKAPTVGVHISVNIEGVPTGLHGYAEEGTLDDAIDLAVNEVQRTVIGQRDSYVEAANKIGDVL